MLRRCLRKRRSGSGFLATIGEGYHHFYYYCCFVLLPDSDTPGAGEARFHRDGVTGLGSSILPGCEMRANEPTERKAGFGHSGWTKRTARFSASRWLMTNSLLFPTLLIRSSVLFLPLAFIHPAGKGRKRGGYRLWGEKFRTLRGCVRVFSSLDFGFSLLLGYGGHSVFAGWLPDYVQRT